MAEVEELTREDVDRLLTELLYDWQRLPSVSTKFDQWDSADRVTFIEEWSIQESYLHLLGEAASRGALTNEQSSRYDELVCIVEQNRPILSRIQQR